MPDGNLMVYNIETNEIGYIVPDLYYTHGSTYSYYSPRTMPLEVNYKKVIGNLSFLANPNNKWVAVMNNSLIQNIKVEVESAHYTQPYYYYNNDDQRIYFCRDINGDILPGEATITCKEYHKQWNGDWSEYTSSPAYTTESWCKPGYVAGYPEGYRTSQIMNVSAAASLMREIQEYINNYSIYYVRNLWKNQRTNGSLPIVFVDSNYTASSAKYSFIAVIAPCLADRGSFGTTHGTWPYNNNFNFDTVWATTEEPAEIKRYTGSVYYDAGTLPTVLQNYINRFFSGEAPTYIGDVTQDLLPEESIYTPGGDTSDPYNPYPSGDSPYTVDPLDSGTETVSPDTDGTWKLPFDNVPDSPATVHSVNLGLYNAYALSGMQVMELANYLFSGITEIGENLVKLIWGSKRDVVISLIEFPLMITNQGVEEIRFIFDTELAGMFHGKQLTNEYLPIDFGTIEVPRYSGTFYDFEPYTTLTLYIPYIGYIDLKPTEVIGSTLSISGYIHLTTGEINVNVKSSRTGILGSYSGTIGRMLPIADADATEIYSAIIKTAASLGAVAVAGVGASSAAATAASIGEPSTEAVEVASANYVNAIEAWGSADKNIRQYSADMKIAAHDYQRARNSYGEAKSKYNQVSKAASNSQEAFHDAVSEAGSNTLDAVTTGFNVSRGTVMTSSNGRLSPQRCFLRIEVPHQNVSRNQKILGYPANSSDSLNSNRLHGYTELRTIELSIPRATLTEIQELENILKGGFYLP